MLTLLPEPDSPTSPSTSPRPTDRSTPSTAFTMPSPVKNQVRSPLISSSGGLPESGVPSPVSGATGPVWSPPETTVPLIG